MTQHQPSLGEGSSVPTAEEGQAYRRQQGKKAKEDHDRTFAYARAHTADQGKEGWEGRLTQKDGSMKAKVEWAAKALPNTPAPQAAADGGAQRGKAGAEDWYSPEAMRKRFDEGRAQQAAAKKAAAHPSRLSPEDRRAKDETERAGAERMQRTDKAIAELDRKQHAEQDQARKDAQELKKFTSVHSRRMVLIQTLLDVPPLGGAAAEARAKLVQMLWRGAAATGEDSAIQAARHGDFANAHKRLDTAWKYAKELQREQAAISTEPGLAKTLGTTLANSVIDRGELMQLLQLAVEVAKVFVSMPDAIRSLNKAFNALGLPSAPAEFSAVWELEEDIVNAAKAVSALSEAGAASAALPIGTAAAGILSVGIVAGVFLEMLSVIKDLTDWLLGQKQTTTNQAMSNVVSVAKSIADALEPIISKTGPLIKFGKLIRKYVHKH